MSVPDVLLSGNHAAIAKWRLEQRKMQNASSAGPDLWQAYLKRRSETDDRIET